MCKALQTRTVTTEFACNRLFGPALLSRLEELEFHPNLVHAIHLAMELEDVERLIPEKLEASLSDIDQTLLTRLRSMKPGRVTGERWLTKLK